MNDLTQNELKKVLNYNPETGIFTRKIVTSNSVKIGDIAGSINANGYISISIKNKIHYAHRLAWLYMTGKWPSRFIDHINNIKNDNRFINIRECNRAENYRNRSKNKNNTSGYKGVSLNKEGNKWRANATFNMRLFFLGEYSKIEDASAAYQNFCKTNHEEFYFDTNGGKNE